MDILDLVFVPFRGIDKESIIREEEARDEHLKFPFLNQTISPHVFSFPVGYHFHSLLLLALSSNPFSSVSEIFKRPELPNQYLSYLNSNHAEVVDFTRSLELLMTFPPLGKNLEDPLKKHFKDQVPPFDFSAHQFLIPDFCESVFTMIQFFNSIMLPISYVSTWEDILNTVYQIDPVPKLLVPYYFLTIDNFPFVITKSVNLCNESNEECVVNVIGARLSFLIYTLNNFYYLAYPTDDVDENLIPKCVIFSDGKTSIENLPQDPSINVVLACYISNRYHQQFTIERALPEGRILHPRMLPGDDLFLRYLRNLQRTVTFDTSNIETFLYQNLLNPFQFLIDFNYDGRRDENMILLSYLYHLTNSGNSPNLETYARDFQRYAVDLQQSKIWTQVQLFQIFSMNLINLLYDFTQGGLNVQSILLNMVSCCPVHHRGAYEIMLKAVALSINQLFGTGYDTDEQFDYLILDLVGQEGYGVFCTMIGRQCNPEMSRVEVNLNFMLQHLVNVFNVTEEKQKLYSWISSIQGYYNPYWTGFPALDLTRFNPSQSLLLYLNRLAVSSPFLI